MKPIDDLLEQHEKRHGNSCPGTLLALRMAVLGCALVGIEDPRGADRNKLWSAPAERSGDGALDEIGSIHEVKVSESKAVSPLRSATALHRRGHELIVWVEIDRWLADAVEVVTGARLGKRTLKFLDYGKLAATFLNVETGKAVRIAALESSRRLADLRNPEIESKYARQMQTYREAAEEELFAVETVEVHLRENDAPGHPRSRVICRKCGEEVNDGREVNAEDGSKVCRPCAYVESSQGHRGLVRVGPNAFYIDGLYDHEREPKFIGQ